MRLGIVGMDYKQGEVKKRALSHQKKKIHKKIQGQTKSAKYGQISGDIYYPLILRKSHFPFFTF